jgi:hypothetical protein
VSRWFVIVFLLLGIALGQSLQRDADVPELPFPDNLDASQCGIPEVWQEDEAAWLTGYYNGELVQPEVYLYNSHSRLHVTGKAESGTQVEIVLRQINPVLNYYLVKTPDGQEGWIPEPFLTFEQPQTMPNP